MNKNILICDDEISVIRSIQQKLEEKGYRVFDSLSGKGLRNKIEQSHPSLILLDFNLLFQPWEELARYLKNNIKTKDIPLIIFSARKTGHQMAKDIGVDLFIYKGKTCIEKLIESVDKFLLHKN